MRIFVAGASGVIGVRLVPLLVAAGHEVAGLTRSPGKAGQLRALGAEPVVCDVFDAGALAAASAGGADRVIAQSIAWELPNESGRAVTAEHERSVLGAGGVVIRYGQLYGPGTYYESGRLPDPPRVHADDAAHMTLLGAPPGLTVVDDRGLPLPRRLLARDDQVLGPGGLPGVGGEHVKLERAS